MNSKTVLGKYIETVADHSPFCPLCGKYAPQRNKTSYLLRIKICSDCVAQEISFKEPNPIKGNARFWAITKRINLVELGYKKVYAKKLHKLDDYCYICGTLLNVVKSGTTMHRKCSKCGLQDSIIS